MLVDFKRSLGQPPKGPVGGQIARAYLYMSEQYGLRPPPNSVNCSRPGTFYPAGSLGGERNRRIGKLQAIPTPLLKSSANSPI